MQTYTLLFTLRGSRRPTRKDACERGRRVLAKRQAHFSQKIRNPYLFEGPGLLNRCLGAQNGTWGGQKGARGYPQDTEKGRSDSGPKKVISPHRFRVTFGSQNGAKSGTRRRQKISLENVSSGVALAEHFCVSGALPCSKNAIKHNGFSLIFIFSFFGFGSHFGRQRGGKGSVLGKWVRKSGAFLERKKEVRRI